MDPSIFYENLKTRLVERIGNQGAQAVESLGLLGDDPIVKCGTPLDTLSHYLSKKLQLGEY
jgi:alpha-aminoadipic semialdehyde synthase